MTLLWRNAGLLSLSFLMSAMVNVLPQRFFSLAAPDEKETLLALTLVLGTIAALAGVELARRRGAARSAFPVVMITAVLAWWQLHASSVGLHIALHVVVRGCGNFLAQELDRRTVVLAGAAQRTANDRLGTALRFCGMLLGPAWFAFVDGKSPFTLLMLGALSALLVVSAIATRDAARVRPELVRDARLNVPGRMLVAAAVLIYAAYYLLASGITYVLMDVHHVENAGALAGRLITLVYGSAIVATVGLAPLFPRGVATAWMVAAPGLMVITGAALPMRVSSVVMTLGAVALGVAFALYMLAFRNHATRKASEGEPGWIAVFNNLGNTSALTGYGVMAALVASKLALSTGVMLLGALGVMATVIALRVARGVRHVET